MKSIKERWIQSERYELILALENAPRGAATGGEGAGMIWKFFFDLEEKNIEAYKEVEDLVEEYWKWGRKHGSIFKRRGKK